jgi:hypothetical protein
MIAFAFLSPFFSPVKDSRESLTKDKIYVIKKIIPWERKEGILPPLLFGDGRR